LPITLTVTEPEPEEPEYNFCEYTDNGNLEIRSVEFKTLSGFGDDENYWYPLDKIQVEVELKNTGNEKIKGIDLEWGLFDLSESPLESTDDIISGEESIGTIKDGKRETITFELDLSEGDMEDLADGDYAFFVWATGEDQTDELDTCVSEMTKIHINIDDFLVLQGLDLTNTAQCESQVQYILSVWNIGDTDQEEVSVQVYNKELGINKIFEIGDVDAFEKADTDLIFAFQIPKGLDEKSYRLKFTIYDEDNDVFENDEDDESIFTTYLKVEGNCYLGNASVNALLQEGGKAGEPLIIKTTITNTGTKVTTYALVTTGFEKWASAVEISQNNFALVPGESRDVLLTFNVNKDVSGDQLLNLETYSDVGLISTQPISISIEKAGLNLSNLFEKGNITGFIILNVILIIIIILVVVKIVKRK